MGLFPSRARCGGYRQERQGLCVQGARRQCPPRQIQRSGKEEQLLVTCYRSTCEDGGREHSLFFKSRLFFNEILNRCSRISQDSEFYFGTSEESWRDWLFQNI